MKNQSTVGAFEVGQSMVPNRSVFQGSVFKRSVFDHPTAEASTDSLQ